MTKISEKLIYFTTKFLVRLGRAAILNRLDEGGHKRFILSQIFVDYQVACAICGNWLESTSEGLSL